MQVEADLNPNLVALLREYNPSEPYRAVPDLDADPPVYAANFSSTKSQPVSTCLGNIFAEPNAAVASVLWL